ncbi:hypothetical protein MPH_12393 [Macrophomina phaseolina MS6]|uniref:Uncharacterized protein n=1 Tax=Macrophomina phaseolina (strain MS6) TaxID=1126212 RepID=K2S1G7_MACPH|nr:hypothetical protein MPH_12393 [Macrophomina phaseolina MS6]
MAIRQLLTGLDEGKMIAVFIAHHQSIIALQECALNPEVRCGPCAALFVLWITFATSRDSKIYNSLLASKGRTRRVKAQKSLELLPQQCPGPLYAGHVNAEPWIIPRSLPTAGVRLWTKVLYDETGEMLGRARFSSKRSNTPSLREICTDY